MRVLVTGVCGQLGFDVMKELKKRGHIGIGSDIQECSNTFSSYHMMDITDKDVVQKVLGEVKPDAVINCAAWTAVDKAEECKNIVYRVNALGPKYIVETCALLNIPILQVSTDYVFDGKGDEPFEVDSPKGGLSTYGKTKSDGEDFVINATSKYFIVRTTGVFGINGNNFIKTMLRLADMGKKDINVVNDQIVSVTYTKDLAVLLVDMIETDKYGIYHAANGGYFPWCEFAREIFLEAGKSVKVNEVTTEQYKLMVPNQTDRPKNSRLSMKSLDKMGFNRLPDHLDALRRYLRENKQLR